MKRHINYLKYLIRHKWYVYLGCRKVGASLWLAIIHDASKFKLSEWLPYARCFYAPDGSKQYNETDAFTFAWNDHQKHNKHHWQYWLITWDRGTTEPLPMPRKYILEMVGDWMGAGKAITGKWEAPQWYEKNKQNIQLHPDTRLQVEAILKESSND